MERLPHWCLTDKNPAFYDTESATAIEQTAKVYGAMNELIDETNKFTKTTNEHISDYEKSVDDKLQEQDEDIANQKAVVIPAKITSEVQRQIDNGTFDAQINKSLGNLNERVNNMLENTPEGGTTLDAELIDIRTGLYGNVFDNSGNAVRDIVEKSLNPFSNLFPLLTRGHGSLENFNGCSHEVGEKLAYRLTSTSTYGSLYLSRKLPATAKKIMFISEIIPISGECETGYLYFYNSGEQLSTTRAGKILSVGDRNFTVTYGNIPDAATSVWLGTVLLKSNAVCEVDNKGILLDITNFDDTAISDFISFLESDFSPLAHYENWNLNGFQSNVYRSLYSDNAISSNKTFLASYMPLEKVEDCDQFGCTVTVEGDNVTAVSNTSYGAIKAIKSLTIGNSYLIVWEGFAFGEVGCMDKSGSGWHRFTVNSVEVNGKTYYYSLVTVNENCILSGIYLQPVKNTTVTIPLPYINDVTGLEDQITNKFVSSCIEKKEFFILPILKQLEEQGDLNSSYWKGKKVLFMGDSLTAARQYQNTVANILGIEYTNHCLGGAGILSIIDGNSSGTITAITAEDVADKDLIVFYAGYNDRGTADGAVGDCYKPDGTGQNTIAGRMQYAINRIYECLAAADNLDCKILIVTVDCAGKYDYIDADGYSEYPAGSGRTMETLANMQKSVAESNSLACCDLWHTSGINRNTWSVFGANPNAYIENPTNTSTPYPHNGDQLHKSPKGYQRIGEVIAGAIIHAFGT